MSSKTGDLDLDLQGQIGLETSKILVLFFLIYPIRTLSSKLNCFFDHLNIAIKILKIDDVDLDLQGQIGLQTSKFLF